MRIEINPTTLKNLEHTCHVLYQLHPTVLDYVLKMNRDFGSVMGNYGNLKNITFEQREFISKVFSQEKPKMEPIKVKPGNHFFHDLRHYLRSESDNFIPIKFYIEIEDEITGRKIKEVIEALKTGNAPEEIVMDKNEKDQTAFFAEGYGIEMSKEQEELHDKFMEEQDHRKLEKLLKVKKLI